MEITKELEQAGFRENEIRTYLYLLGQGTATPPQIAQGTKIARPNCYKILQTLKEKGLIIEQQQGKRKVYSPSDPSVLVHTLQLRAEAMTQLLPDLRAMFSAQKNKPSIRFFEGVEQVKEIFYEMLEAKEVAGIASTKKLYEVIGSDFFKKLIKQMQDKKIFLRDILTKESVNTAAPTPIGILKGLYEYRVLPETTHDLPVDILIWNDKAAFLTVDGPVFGTLIQNQAIADMLKITFELAWKQLAK